MKDCWKLRLNIHLLWLAINMDHVFNTSSEPKERISWGHEFCLANAFCHTVFTPTADRPLELSRDIQKFQRMDLEEVILKKVSSKIVHTLDLESVNPSHPFGRTRRTEEDGQREKAITCKLQRLLAALFPLLFSHQSATNQPHYRCA